MADILLLRFDTLTRESLADLLRRRGHRVVINSGAQSLSGTLRKGPTDFDLVMLDVSFDDAVTRRYIATLRAHLEQHGFRPMLLCVAQVYRGPQFELELERKGARVVYVR